jgi:ribosomal protein S18 acetylase RimI-like enzyme
MAIAEDTWLSGIFGYPVFRAGLSSESSEGIQVIADHTKSQQTAFYYTKLKSEDVELASRLSAAGFFVVDMSVTLDREVDTTGTSELPADIEISEVHPNEHEAAMDIAATCFRYSRFHLDPMVAAEIADRIKREWVRNYLLGRRGDRLDIARVGSEPAGFLCVSTSKSEGREFRIIDLVGVHERYQGQGVGRALVSHFIHRESSSCDRLLVGTQSANIPSIRLYESQGFRVAKTQLILHMHVRDGMIQI